MKKLFITFVVFFIIVASFSNIRSVQAEQDFVDVPPSHWAYEAIHYMASMGIVTGYPDGTFKPDKPILRQEMAIIACKIFNFDGLRPNKPTYTDVPSNHWAFPMIETIAESKLMDDTSLNNRFRPGEVLDRIEYVPLQCRCLGMKFFAQHMSNETMNDILSRYSDASTIPNWAKNYLAILTASRAIGGFPDGTFKPFEPLTRAQICVSMYNMLKPLGPNQPVSTPASFNVVVNGALLTPFLSTNLQGSMFEFTGKGYANGYVSLTVNDVPFMPYKSDASGLYTVRVPIGIIPIGGITMNAHYYESKSNTPSHSFQAYSSVPFDLFPNAYRLYGLQYDIALRQLSYLSELATGNMLISVENTTTNEKQHIAPKAGERFTLKTTLKKGGNHVNLALTNKENSYRLIYGFDFNSN
ncbi:MAG: S-layer homology domain-containing protein [Caldisericia bacterium]|nr:S-layer homology domain-containing protein [Caldisericia bacterium]